MRKNPQHHWDAHAKKPEEYEKNIIAVRNDEIDALVTPGSAGDRVYTLQGADHTCRVILETLDEGVATITPDGTVLFCNRCLAKMLSLPMEKILGRQVTDFCPSADHPVITALFHKGLTDGCKGEISLQEAGSTMIPVQVSCNSLHLESPVLCLTFMDLRALKAAQLSLEKINARLEKKVLERTRVLSQKNLSLRREIARRTILEQKLGHLQDEAELKKMERLSEIGTLAATVAHELRNPLAVIGIIAYNLSRETGNQPELAKYITDIEKKIIQSSQIIDNLLSYSRIKLPQYEDVPVYELINNCLLETKEKFKDKEVQVSVSVSPLKQKILRADLFQVNQILNNLLTNAWEAAPLEGGRIGVSGKFEHGHIVIQIEDNGHGIPPEHIENVFKPFFTLKSKGTGLGLAVCREMIHLHDGKIKLTSAQGKGTTVTLLLPKRSAP